MPAPPAIRKGLVNDAAEVIDLGTRGRRVEDASTEELCTHPSHEYTKELLETTPSLVS
jgi:ABC-type oligopeptide transport system ATPase subunit